MKKMQRTIDFMFALSGWVEFGSKGMMAIVKENKMILTIEHDISRR